MAIGDLRLMDALRTKMQWHQARQRILAENVANADTPRFKGRDLAAPVFTDPSASSSRGGPSTPTVQLAVTRAGHMAGTSGSGRFKADSSPQFEVTANGNAVDLEEQMARSAENQLDFQTATSLYQQSMGLIRTALGRK